MSTQYRLVQSGKTASGGCSAGPRFVRAVAPRLYLFIGCTFISLRIILMVLRLVLFYIHTTTLTYTNRFSDYSSMKHNETHKYLLILKLVV
jgi:hypothetical protein